MKRRSFPTAHAAIPNLAPMVDVVMVILIFFMLGTSFALSEGVLPTQLPSQIGPGGGASVSIVPAVRIELREGPGGACQIVVMDRELQGNSFEALAAYMKEKINSGADPMGRVVLAADPGIVYQDVISAMDACVRAGFRNIQFSLGGVEVTGVEPDVAP